MRISPFWQKLILTAINAGGTGIIVAVVFVFFFQADDLLLRSIGVGFLYVCLKRHLESGRMIRGGS